MSLPLQSATPNLLLRAMTESDFALLAPHLQPVPLEAREVLHASGKAIERVHFIESGVASIVTADEGGTVEAGLYGFEGFSGLAVVLGAGSTPHGSLIQIGQGRSLAIAADRLMEACMASASLHLLLLRFVHTLSVQSDATAASNANFELPERLARWLLMCHDRVPGDRLDLTHEFMGVMLAVRRSGVTVTLHTLEATGAIRSTRGVVTILDRERLIEIAGGSYGTPEREYRRLISKDAFN